MTTKAIFSTYPQLNMLGMPEDEILTMSEPDIVKWCISHHRREVSAILVHAHRIGVYSAQKAPDIVIKNEKILLQRSIDRYMPIVLYKNIFLR